VILWPAGMAVLVVWLVFGDPAIDYRLVVAGALLPDVVDGPLGGARFLHALLFSVALLVTVMLATRHRRRARRRWLALPIGTFLHLLVDGMWTHTHTVWWPFFGTAFADRLPALAHGPVVLALEEAAGLVVLLWAWRRFGLSDPARRTILLRTGRLPRDVAA
jgi:membrane-bound metal-dependent hydrolase YbcI (DUF457 family)